MRDVSYKSFLRISSTLERVLLETGVSTITKVRNEHFSSTRVYHSEMEQGILKKDKDVLQRNQGCLIAVPGIPLEPVTLLRSIPGVY